MTDSVIASVHARQILDSRGRPTVEADVTLADGSLGRGVVPSGASTGRHEALELRDGGTVYEGRGVLTAVAHVNGAIAQAVAGIDASDQAAVDAAMGTLDSSTRFETLGANAVLSVSLAACRAAAVSRGIPLYKHLAELAGGAALSLPVPMVNILSGGAHAGRSMDIQDFLAIPVGASSYSEALEWLVRVRMTAARLLAEDGRTILLADEGGLAPGYADPRAAMDLMMRAFEESGLTPGRDMAVTLDVAASELFVDEHYQLRNAGLTLDAPQMIDYVAALVDAYPIVSVEDVLEQDDWDAWAEASRRMPDIQLVGDDLFVTNPARIAEGERRGAANAALIKVNQNGTLTGTLAAMRTAWQAGFATVVSARSGETEDSFIADLAVAGGRQIKIGSVRTSDRMAKYNQLLRIAEDPAIPFATFKPPAPGRSGMG